MLYLPSRVTLQLSLPYVQSSFGLRYVRNIMGTLQYVVAIGTYGGACPYYKISKFFSSLLVALKVECVQVAKCKEHAAEESPV